MLTTILAFGIGLLCTNLWPDWPRPIRHLGPVTLTVALVLDLYQSWMKKETFSGICWAAVILLGVVAYIRNQRLQRQFKDAKHWTLTKGGFSGNYEDGGDRVIYCGYQVAGSYYSGFVAAGSTLTTGLKSRLDALKGKPALIRYKPDQPEISTLFQSDQLEAKL